jgi:hypothetical protein
MMKGSKFTCFNDKSTSALSILAIPIWKAAIHTRGQEFVHDGRNAKDEQSTNCSTEERCVKIISSTQGEKRNNNEYSNTTFGRRCSTITKDDAISRIVGKKRSKYVRGKAIKRDYLKHV